MRARVKIGTVVVGGEPHGPGAIVEIADDEAPALVLAGIVEDTAEAPAEGGVDTLDGSSSDTLDGADSVEGGEVDTVRGSGSGSSRSRR
ncbi:hypothetical protein GXW78_07590 [Roseomonas terrae]|uniref:Uncharacterized protein n=1 Tax=Neoroseomonas terrae TaxID=424799 RepID=A0ABS5EER8_9PROT|nr:hypothetical protein [Neoroseomonas terrae]MBR0649517.1 hypothetical protein [Neoroseomonas terrae]